MTNVWYYWAGVDYGTSATTNTITGTGNQQTWQIWNDGTAGTSAATNNITTGTSDGIWGIWVEPATDNIVGTKIVYSDGTIWKSWAEVHEQTAEEKEQARVKQEQLRLQQEEQLRKKQEADARATELLKLFLTEEQRKQFDENGSFIIKKGKKSYKIKMGWSQNVEELNESGKAVARLCAHPANPVPDADNMLAQKIMLENAEDEFLRIANRSLVY